MKPATYSDILKLHNDIFGVDPVFYGESTEPRINLVAEAIESGNPYIEKPIPEDVCI